ncbi:MAG: hypothetical protein KBF57_11625 [Saprospiraceae bacterium]|jgi:hypothetical protein|nr:hypothetical protein [Saprospiraceae bacterium]
MITSFELTLATEGISKGKTIGGSVYHALCEVMAMNKSEADRMKASESLFKYCSDGVSTNSEKLLTTIFLKALNRRMQSDVICENIYQSMAGVSQIELFDILIDQFPFVKYSQQLVNEAIIADMQNQEVVTLIDIGIGLGTQMMHVIEKAKALPSLKKLIIVGLEPFADALSMAEKNITEINSSVPFEIQFVPVLDYAERFDFTSLTCIEGAVIINASLALHHIRTLEERKATLENLRLINPVSLYMIEPNVDHFEPEFFPRFKNSWNHFYCLFRVIDLLNITQDQKNGLKLFFGREIEDIIGKSEEDRFEKHMLATEWMKLLRACRFEPNDKMLSNPFTARPGVDIATHAEGYIGFTYDHETALALIQAVPFQQ